MSGYHPGAMLAETLLQVIEPVGPEATLADVFERFAGQPECVALPVVDGSRAVGLVTRKAVIERFARPFARELFGKRPISSFMESAPLVVEASANLDDVSRRIVEAGMQHMYDGFILTRDGAYAGMGTGADLMRVLTERKQAHLYQLAHFDALTGLPNRLLFRDRLSKAMLHARRSGHLIALLFLDLDGFKLINDTLGHAAGDELLQIVAQRIAERVRQSDTLARMGGDEFTILLTEVNQPEDAGRVAREVVRAAEEPCLLGGHEVRVSASVGVTVYPLDYTRDEVESEDIEPLLRNADAAMYRAKAEGKNNFQFYSAALNTPMLERLMLENDLRRAVENRELVLHYQPRVNCINGEVTAVEALIRWQHPKLGLLAPARFIPLAEETGLMVTIGEWALRTACAQARRWRESGLDTLRVAVNLSPRQFHHPDLVDTVECAMADFGLAGGSLELELTETLAMTNVTQSVVTLGALRQIGVGISIDDFGTGYSSVAYLRRLAIDHLKIDQSFVQDLALSEDSRAIARTILSMAHSLQLRVIAEGVETAEQVEFLCRHGCQEAQGFLMARPMPPDDVAVFIRSADAGLAQKIPA